MNANCSPKICCGDRIVLTDGARNEHTYTVITSVLLSGQTYVVLMAVDARDATNFTIMRFGQDESGRECFAPVSSEAEINRVKLELDKTC